VIKRLTAAASCAEYLPDYEDFTEAVRIWR